MPLASAFPGSDSHGGGRRTVWKTRRTGSVRDHRALHGKAPVMRCLFEYSRRVTNPLGLWPRPTALTAVQNSTDCCPHLGDALESHVRYFPLIIAGGFPNLICGRSQKPPRHDRNPASIPQGASSPSSARSFPSRYACDRSRDSASQAWSKDACSAGSKLRQSVSITCPFPRRQLERFVRL